VLKALAVPESVMAGIEALLRRNGAVSPESFGDTLVLATVAALLH